MFFGAEGLVLFLLYVHSVISAAQQSLTPQWFAFSYRGGEKGRAEGALAPPNSVLGAPLPPCLVIIVYYIIIILKEHATMPTNHCMYIPHLNQTQPTIVTTKKL